RLKTLKGRSPYEFICDRWQENPEVFHTDPHHLTSGLYTTVIAESTGTDLLAGCGNTSAKSRKPALQ
ncbi:MAG: hypothetical protein OXG23_08290, partial [Chloroflexi bacterium]|nr:hypothetical protein [Chloroflexota bacterium]